MIAMWIAWKSARSGLRLWITQEFGAILAILGDFAISSQLVNLAAIELNCVGCSRIMKMTRNCTKIAGLGPELAGLGWIAVGLCDRPEMAFVPPQDGLLLRLACNPCNLDAIRSTTLQSFVVLQPKCNPV